MGTYSGRPVDDGNKAFERFRLEVNSRIEQIMRQLNERPKPPVIPQSGGIVGVSRCEAYSFQVQNDGIGSTIAVTEWGIRTIFEGAGAGVTSGGGSQPSLVVAAAGWYTVNASWEMAWNEADGTLPTHFSVTAPYSSSPEPGFYEPAVEAYPAPKPPNAEVRAWLAFGPILLPAGGTIDLGGGWNNLTPHNGAAAHVDVTLWA
ncbi:MAG TPA: hypothetical protein VIR15_09830 [Intrasporangium sp.]|uniref:hypothetical protein n=1 Tax=Intrasporangium sp. TaxID=1925024 RepID=UPI002F9325AE